MKLKCLDIQAFKIDLIVWKYKVAVTDATNKLKFKIDLIVWKSTSNCSISNVYPWFKIDLIVWKCNY